MPSESKEHLRKPFLCGSGGDGSPCLSVFNCSSYKVTKEHVFKFLHWHGLLFRDFPEVYVQRGIEPAVIQCNVFMNVSPNSQNAAIGPGEVDFSKRSLGSKPRNMPECFASLITRASESVELPEYKAESKVMCVAVLIFASVFDTQKN